MKQYRSLFYLLLSFILIIFLALNSCRHKDDEIDDNRPEILKGDKIPGDYTWTIMVYLDGDNNLESFALEDMNEMELVDLASEGVNVIVLVDRCLRHTTEDGNWSGTRLYEIQADNNETIESRRLADPVYLGLTDTGNAEELNMGDPATVTAFINFCQYNYPASRYALIFWNHGDGWKNKTAGQNLEEVIRFKPRFIGSDKEKKLNENIDKSVCSDEDNQNDILYMSEVQSAISGKGLHLVGFDACLMGMVEVAYQIKDDALVMVASEETEPSSGWVYDRFLHSVINLIDNSEENVGIAIVDTYIDYTNYNDLTLSAIDLTNMDALINAINTFATNLQLADNNDICKGRGETLCFYEPHYIDLYHFAQQMPGVTGSEDVIIEINNTVIHHRHRDFPDSHGLSIYYPYYNDWDSEYSAYNVTTIKFPADSAWDEFLSDYYSKCTLYTVETFPNGGSGSEDTDTYLVIFSSTLNYIYENDDGGLNYHSKLELPLASGETYYILVFEYWNSPGPYSILVNDTGGGSSFVIPGIDAYEPNDIYQEANNINYNVTQDHYLEYSDEDWMYLTDVP